MAADQSHPAAPADPANALPRATRLGEFELLRVLGVGGFGIVYLAFDHALEREVAVKEYMPASLAGRTAALQVAVISQAHADSFALGLRSFVNEARLLARFDHPALVKVYRYWEANGTAYMAMPFYAGRNLQQLRQTLPQPPDEAWLRAILEPLLGALERLHGEGVYHRDISPDNVIVQADGQPVLLDFGAARRVIGDKSVALTAILKPAYAPIEQYGEAGPVRQGPWTDLYALGATLHFLLLGRAPQPATSRTMHDEAPPLRTRALVGCSTPFLACLDWMLSPLPAQRPQSVAALREVLAGQREAPLSAPVSTAPGRSDIELDIDLPTPTEVLPRSPPPPPPPDGPTQRVDPWFEPTRVVARQAPAAEALPDAGAAPRSRSLRWALAGGAVAVALAAFWGSSRTPGTKSVVTAPTAASSAPAPALAASTAAADAAPSQASAPAVASLPPAAVETAASVAGPVPAPETTGTRVDSSSTRLAQPQTSAKPAVRTPPMAARTTPRTISAPPAPGPAVPAAQVPAAIGTQIIASPLPAATAAPPTVRDPEGAPMRSRVLSPSERCEGRPAHSIGACIEQQCRTAPELQNHPDCSKPRP